MKLKNKVVALSLCALLMVFSMAWPGTAAFAQDSPPQWTSAGPDPSLNQVTCLLAMNNQLYKGTSGVGVLLWNGTTWTQVGSSWPSGDAAICLADISGTLYAGAELSGVWALESGIWTQVGTWPSESGAFCLAEFNDTVYAGSYGGVWALNDGTWTEVGASSWPLAYDIPDFPDSADCLVNVDGKLYVQTTFNGVYVLDSNGNWIQAGTAWPTVGVSDDSASCLLAAGGTIYAGTIQSGVWTLIDDVWTLVGTSSPGDGVSSLAYVAGTLYAGTDDGMWTLDGDEWSPVYDFPIPSDMDYCLASTGETLYCGGGNHVYGLNDGDWNEVGSWNGLPFDNAGLRGLPLADVNGILYAGTVGGVLALDNDAWTQVGALSWPIFDGFGDRACSLLVDDGGTVYAGTGYSGVYALGSGGGWTLVGNSWPSGYGVWCLAFFDGMLYAGTYDLDTSSSYNNGAGVLALVDGDWTPVGENTDGRWVTSLASVNGTVYASTWGGGVWALEGGEWTSLDSGPSSMVYTLEDLDGTLYVGGYEGVGDDCILWSWDGNSWTEKASEQPDGRQMIYGLKEIDGTLYAGTDHGVFSVDADGSGGLTQVGSYNRPCLSFADVGGTLYTGTEYNGVLAYVTTYNVTFNSNGSVHAIKNVNAGESIGSADWPDNPTRNSYTFGGWFTGENGAGTQFTSATPVNAAMTVYAKWTADNPGGGGGGGNLPSTPTYNADIEAGNGAETNLPVTVNKDNGTATVDTGSQKLTSGETVITIPSIPDVGTYSVGIPVSSLSTLDGQGTLTLDTDAGSITVPSNMLAGVSGISGSKAEITIGEGNKSGLPEDVKAAIGDRPLVQLTLSVDGKQAGWSNPDAPVTVRIPYTPTAAELQNPESIVIWYIDGGGNVVTIPNGLYDPETEMVTFSTTHFSLYAVTYKEVSFNDVAAGAWYSKAVSFIAVRGITTGTGNGNYSPDAGLTRGEFIVLTMRACGIAPAENPTDNFSDAGNTYYTGYLAAAKRLGISAGVGGNLYAPGKEITRQEMFTLLYNALNVIGQLPQGDSGKTLSEFSDARLIDAWALDAMTLLVETGTVGGNNGKLTPTSTTTRAEMAQVLYNLISK